MKEEKQDIQTNAETNNEEIKQTIAPTTPIEEKKEKIIDLSAIVPNFEEMTENSQIELSSREKDLKTDGAVILGTIKGEEITPVDNIVLPNQIDIAFRAAEAKKNKDKKKKIETDPEKEALRIKTKNQNIMSMVALVIIIGLVGFYFYYTKSPKMGDFKVLDLNIELGEPLPTRASSYIKPVIGTTVDDLAYIVDTSNVIVDQVGTYEYTIKHNNTEKKGIISIVDTTEPDLEVRSVVISEGETYNAETFVATCKDLSGCTYSFENQATESKYNSAGTYVVYIVATDAYENKTLKQASLVIEAQGMVKMFKKEYTYNFDEGYQLTEKYELHFTNFMSNAIILNGKHTSIYTYQTKEVYDKSYKEHNGDVNYSFDEINLTMTVTEQANTVGYNYSRLGDVTNYLTENGFIEQG